jgi:Tol biopolymer transport system component
MSGKIRFLGLVTLMGLLGTLLLFGVSGWAQKAKPPQPPPPPPADPAIAFRATGSGTNLMVMNADGSNQRILLNGTKGTNVISCSPNWSPDGNRIAFYSDIWGSGIYIINKDGTGLLKVIAMHEGGTYGAGNPHWSPDGLRIIYSDSLGPGLNEDIYLVDAVANAGSRINLTNSPGAEFYPSWGPDGLRLAANVDAGPIILFNLLEPDGTHDWMAVPVQNLTESGPFADELAATPEWARFSDKIVVSAADDIWVIDFTDPGNLTYRNLTQTLDIRERNPCWSPLDTQIVYDRASCIYVMHADGSNVTRIAAPNPKSLFLSEPDWRRNL